MTTTWVIEWMNCKPVEGNFADVVVNAGWRCTGIEDKYTSEIYGTASFSLNPDQQSYTPYNQLTQEQVLEWVWSNGVDKNAAELIIQSKLEALINPPVVTLPLPWA